MRNKTKAMKDPYKMTKAQLIAEVIRHRNAERALYKTRPETSAAECEIKSHRACTCKGRCEYFFKRNLNED